MTNASINELLAQNVTNIKSDFKKNIQLNYGKAIGFVNGLHFSGLIDHMELDYEIDLIDKAVHQAVRA